MVMCAMPRWIAWSLVFCGGLMLYACAWTWWRVLVMIGHWIRYVVWGV